jgi:hypothetical protein
VLSLVDGAATAHTTSTLRAACELLGAAESGIGTVSLTGRLPSPEDGTLPVLAIAQRLAAEYRLAVQVNLDASWFQVLLRRMPPEG